MRKKPFTGDDEVDQIIREAARAAGRKVPDTIAARTAVPDAFTQLVDLASTRIWNLAEAARRTAAPDVEFATKNARVVMIDEFHTGATAIADNAEACAGRAHARRLDLIDQVWSAEQRVESITHAHSAALEALRRQFRTHLGVLDTAIRTTRGGQHLAYATPTDVDVPDAAYDIGLVRVRNALTRHDTTHPETPNHTSADTGSTEKGAA